MLVFELVMSYPDDDVAEKFNSWIVTEALKFGCVTAAELKTATSLIPGTRLGVPVQLLLVLKSVPVFVQVSFVARADCWNKTATKYAPQAVAIATRRRHIATEKRSPSPRLRRTIHFSKPLPCHLSSTEEWQRCRARADYENSSKKAARAAPDASATGSCDARAISAATAGNDRAAPEGVASCSYQSFKQTTCRTQIKEG